MIGKLSWRARIERKVHPMEEDEGWSERFNKVVIARSEALHRMVYRAKRRGNLHEIASLRSQ